MFFERHQQRLVFQDGKFEQVHATFTSVNILYNWFTNGSFQTMTTTKKIIFYSYLLFAQDLPAIFSPVVLVVTGASGDCVDVRLKQVMLFI